MHRHSHTQIHIPFRDQIAVIHHTVWIIVNIQTCLTSIGSYYSTRDQPPHFGKTIYLNELEISQSLCLTKSCGDILCFELIYNLYSQNSNWNRGWTDKIFIYIKVYMYKFMYIKVALKMFTFNDVRFQIWIIRCSSIWDIIAIFNFDLVVSRTALSSIFCPRKLYKYIWIK